MMGLAGSSARAGARLTRAVCPAARARQVLYTFYKAAKELAKPFCGKLQIPLRMYEAALLHDVYCTLQPITAADLAGCAV